MVNNADYEYEDEVVTRIIRRMQQRRIQDSDSEENEESDQNEHQDKEEPDPDRNDAEFILDLTQELEEMEN